jgi:hypothetical protein
MIPPDPRSKCHQVAFGARANCGLQVACWHQVDLGAEDGLQFSLDPSQPEQANVRRQVNEQVHVTAGREIGACYGLTKQGAQQRFRATRNQAEAAPATPERKKVDPVAAE